MVILRFLESLITMPNDAMWVYEMCEEMPEWDVVKQEYIFRKKPKRIDAQTAKKLIKEHGLVCVCNNEYGRIYE